MAISSQQEQRIRQDEREKLAEQIRSEERAALAAQLSGQQHSGSEQPPALTRAEIEQMTPDEIIERKSEIDRFLTTYDGTEPTQNDEEA
jgi:hypothetical protein